MRFIPARTFLKNKEFFNNHPQLVLITPSIWLSEAASKNPILGNHRIEVVNNPIPNDFFDQSEESRPKNDSMQTIGFISQNATNPYKGLDILVQALENLDPELQRRIKLLIATETRDLIMHKAFECELIHPKGNHEVISFYKQLNFLVVPSLEDNSPSVIGEALACGVPVIGSDVGGIPEILEYFSQGVFEAKNVTDLSSKLRAHLNGNTTEVDRLRVKQKLSEEAHATKLLQLYSELNLT
jgi:glycosyltransferase involved in cell wall biosynthesis